MGDGNIRKIDLHDDLVTEINNATSQMSDMLYQMASGTSTDLTIVLKKALVDGYPINFIARVDNGGVLTTVNTKHLYKPGTTTSPTLKAGRAYSAVYNLTGDCFFIKASASGTAVASDVLAGKTISNDNDTDIIGTMPNRGAINKSLAINETYTIQEGYHDGTGKVSQSVATKAAAAFNPSTSAQTIAAGQYLSGAQTINPVTGTANTGQVLSGYTFASANGVGLTGNIPNFYGAWQYSGGVTPASGRLHMYPPKGYYDPAGSTGVYYDDANFIAANIVSGKSIFGTAGSATIESLGGIRGARSTASTSPFTVSGLSFTPNVVIISHPNTNAAVLTTVYVGTGLASGINWYKTTGSSSQTNGSGVPSGLSIRSDGFYYNAATTGGTIYWLAFAI